MPNNGMPNVGTPNDGMPNFKMPNNGMPNADPMPNAELVRLGWSSKFYFLAFGIRHSGINAEFGIPLFGIPSFGIPLFGIPSFGILP
jgi:hypothetical protein